MLICNNCPFRPSTSNGLPTYFFHWDSVHFRFILNYLKNGVMVQSGGNLVQRKEVPFWISLRSTILLSARSGRGRLSKILALWWLVHIYVHIFHKEDYIRHLFNWDGSRGKTPLTGKRCKSLKLTSTSIFLRRSWNHQWKHVSEIKLVLWQKYAQGLPAAKACIIR